VVEIRWNGELLSDTIRRESDLHFRVLGDTVIGPYGYVLEYDLPRAQYPVRGSNSVVVTLRKRDPKISATLEVYDIDLHIAYRRHRHFQKQPIRF
jgi:hypothetical protein